MKSIFKIYKENRRLEEENKKLKIQHEALVEFKSNFDSYYHSLTDVKFFISEYTNKVELRGAFIFDERAAMYCSAAECKKKIAQSLCEKVLPFVEYDMVDNPCYGAKELVGRLIVLKK